MGKLTISMAIFNSYVSLPEGQPPFSYGFPMIFPFSYGFPMIFPFSYGFPMVFLVISQLADLTKFNGTTAL